MTRKSKYYRVIRKDRFQILIHTVCKNRPEYTSPVNMFARKVGCNPNTLYIFMNENARDLSPFIIYKIAKSTGVSIDWLYGLSDEMFRDKKYEPK